MVEFRQLQRNCVEFEVASDFFPLNPSYVYEEPKTKYPFWISSLTLILLSQQVLLFCKRRVN